MQLLFTHHKPKTRADHFACRVKKFTGFFTSYFVPVALQSGVFWETITCGSHGTKSFFAFWKVTTFKRWCVEMQPLLD